ncbi:MAG: hypothetical protein COB02_11550 [Candidatus Cloacimonadota bacterium]|nr:MAG: hypothetical protein COB02_11550 [Candidatus Cloacimonadota bacterium]
MHKKTWQEMIFILSIFSLLIASFISIILSLELINPNIVKNHYLNFGRLLPLHLNWTLYGWLSYPLIGLLFVLKGECRKNSKLIKLSLLFWLAALIALSISCLTGNSSGKLFLEFTGISRHIFALNLSFLSFTYIYESRYLKGINFFNKYIMNGVAFCIPIVWFIASSAEVYPPINPSSGGPTGVSLMGSTLVIIPIFLLLIKKLDKNISNNYLMKYWYFLLIHFLIFMVFCNHGSISNNNVGQIVSIFSLIIWPFLLIKLYFKNSSDRDQKHWKTSMVTWFLLLSITAVISFLPGVLIHVKFNSILVAHSHIAMAGFLSSFCFLVFDCFVSKDYLKHCLNSNFFINWHLIQVSHVFLLFFMGMIELDGFYYNIDFTYEFLKYLRVLIAVIFFILIALTFRRSLSYSLKKY